ncbi:MAG: hypothetical protein ACREXP_14180 [Steroidobacteraceae bacterium]
MQLLRSAPFFVLFSALLAGCEQQKPMVYVLEGPQDVKLTASASATTVRAGETVTLHVERRITGKWKQIPRDQLTQGQCWLYTLPPEDEPEVADNVEWEVDPEGTVQFDNTFRMDHTRIATMLRKGRVTLRPITAVRCEKDRAEEGPRIRIEVV